MTLIPLTELQRDIQKAARDFAQRDVAPLAAELDRDSRFDHALVARLSELGFPRHAHSRGMGRARP